MYQPKVPITSAAEVKAILGPDIPNQAGKVIDHIDAHCQAWIERCPFIVIASINAAGAMDISPKGDPPGFVRILDRQTLAIPDRLGNHRGDTFFNVLENPSVGIVFIMPRRREVVRVSGTASLAKDPDLLAEMAVKGKTPDLAMIVRVREAFFHCGKSMIRSRLWEPDGWPSIDGLPSYAQALKDHAALTGPLEAVQAGVEYNETGRLY
ncbi:MAG: MSMEG_1061 family FMN-dependent PPOX-type flavoprotein [Alphaproteobacteria bacterium]